MAKVHSKSVRLSNEVFEYVMRSPGEGFNQKFENIVLEAKYGENDRKERLKMYDDLIDKRKKQVSEICKDVSLLKSRICTIQGNIDSIVSERSNYPWK